MKIKIFNGSNSQTLQELLDEWTGQNPDVSVISVHQSESVAMYQGDEATPYHSITITVFYNDPKPRKLSKKIHKSR